MKTNCPLQQFCRKERSAFCRYLFCLYRQLSLYAFGGLRTNSYRVCLCAYARARVRACVCVCVNPWAKGSPPPPFPPQFYTQGAHGRMDGMGQRRPIHVAVKTYLRRDTTPLFLAVF